MAGRWKAQVREHHGAADGRRRADAAQPVVDAGRVEAGGVGVAPRIVGVDGAREAAEQLLDAVVVRALGLRQPRQVVAVVRPLVEQHAGDAGLGDVAGHEGEPELGDEAAVGGVERPDHLAAELHEAPVAQLRLLDPSADASAGLEHQDVGAAPGEVAGCARPARPAPRTMASSTAQAAGAGTSTTGRLVARSRRLAVEPRMARRIAPCPEEPTTMNRASWRSPSSTSAAWPAPADDLDRRVGALVADVLQRGPGQRVGVLLDRRGVSAELLADAAGRRRPVADDEVEREVPGERDGRVERGPGAGGPVVADDDRCHVRPPLAASWPRRRPPDRRPRAGARRTLRWPDARHTSISTSPSARKPEPDHERRPDAEPRVARVRVLRVGEVDDRARRTGRSGSPRRRAARRR